MTPTEIAADLRKAAKIVADGLPMSHMLPRGKKRRIDIGRWNSGLGACYAIKTKKAKLAFEIAMGKYDTRDYWWPRSEKYRNTRVMALLFAAEFVERP